jgi:transcriptional regulator with XRE-family HTH domain
MSTLTKVATKKKGLGGGKRRRTKVRPAGPKVVVPKGTIISVDGVRVRLGMSQIELARITGYSVRSIASWESGKPLSESARQKLTETERLRIALSEIIPANEVGGWLRTPNPAFEGQTPIQVIERGESDRIWRMIWQINAGVAS